MPQAVSQSAFLAQVITLLFLLLRISPGYFVRAQILEPTLVTLSSSAFVDGKALYISGGEVSPQGLYPSQTFKIDLSVSWNVNRPVFTALKLAPPQIYSPGAMSADGTKWYLQAEEKGFLYDVLTDSWTHLFSFPGLRPFGRVGATDPSTGLIYVPHGYLNADTTVSMLVLNVTSGKFSTNESGVTILSQTTEYAAAWSQHLGGMLYVASSGMYTYIPGSGWKNYLNPKDMIAHTKSCLVAAYGGSKMVLFGGFSMKLNTTLSDIFILDVATSVWKKGPKAAANLGRRSPACAASGDYFIAWGGDTVLDGNFSIPAQATILYNIKTDTWTNEYVAPPPAPITTTTSSTASTALITSPSKSPPINGTGSDSATATDSSNRVTVISGAIGGGLVFGLLVGVLFIYRTRTRANHKDTSSSPRPSNDDRQATNRSLSISSSHESSTAIVGTTHSRPPRNPGHRRPPTDTLQNMASGDNVRVGTVQEGALGSNLETRNPHVIAVTDEPYTMEEGGVRQI